MKIQITNYTFNASAKTITFNSFGVIELSRLYAIVDTTQGVIIYQPNSATKNGTVGTAPNANVLTLTYNTSSFSNSDNLQIFYNIEERSKATQNIVELYPELVKDYPNLVADFFDTFEDGDLKGWHDHDQYAQNQAIPAVTISPISARGYSMAIECPKVDGITGWARKSQGTKTIRANAKKMILGLEMAWHAGYQYGGYGFEFGMDTQYVSATSQPLSTSNGRRTWFKMHYRVSTNNSTFDKKWMYDSQGTDTATYTDFGTPAYTAPDGTSVSSASTAYYDIPWNEPSKYSFVPCALVVDIQTGIYEALYCNGFKWNMKSILGGTQALQFPSYYTTFYTGPTPQLPQYQNGANLILRCINRPSSSVNSGMYIDSVFLANCY